MPLNWWLSWTLIGAVIGVIVFLALVLRAKQFPAYLVIGAVGGYLGGLLFSQFFLDSTGAFLASGIGALLLLIGYGLFNPIDDVPTNDEESEHGLSDVMISDVDSTNNEPDMDVALPALNLPPVELPPTDMTDLVNQIGVQDGEPELSVVESVGNDAPDGKGQPDPVTTEMGSADDESPLLESYSPQIDETVVTSTGDVDASDESQHEVTDEPPEIEPGAIGGIAVEGYPDDLTKLRGVGKVYERRLHDVGIYTWAQLADVEPPLLRDWTAASDSANVGEWPHQARDLAIEHDRQNARYRGPKPDDLTNISGIGPSMQRHLYTVGVVTFAQLANMEGELLRSLLPPETRGEQIDLQGWIEQARNLMQDDGASADY